MLPQFIANLLPEAISDFFSEPHQCSHEEADTIKTAQLSLAKKAELEELIGGKVLVTDNDGEELEPGTDEYDTAVLASLNAERRARMTDEDRDAISRLACDLAPLPGDEDCKAPPQTPVARNTETAETIKI